MARFLVGLCIGVAAGWIAWIFSHGNVGLTIFVGLMVALLIWFTRVADEILDWGLDMAGSVIRGIDDLFS